MKRVELRFPPGDVHPVYRLLTKSPHVDRAVGLNWNVTGDGTLTMLHRIRGDVDRVEEALERIDYLETFDVLRIPAPERSTTAAATDERAEAHIYLRDEGTEDSRLLFGLLSSDGVLAIPPIEYDETGASFTVVGEEWALQEIYESVPERFSVKIEAVGGPTPALGAGDVPTLSDRQRAAASVGVELGYFDVPRRASHEDVAAVLECSPSTAAEHLQKAQSKIVRAIVGESDGSGEIERA